MYVKVGARSCKDFIHLVLRQAIWKLETCQREISQALCSRLGARIDAFECIGFAKGKKEGGRERERNREKTEKMGKTRCNRAYAKFRCRTIVYSRLRRAFKPSSNLIQLLELNLVNKRPDLDRVVESGNSKRYILKSFHQCASGIFNMNSSIE